MKVAFTICAKNYLGLARTLETSIKRYNPDIHFFIFVADEFEASDNIQEIGANVIVAKNNVGISENEWYSRAFKYDLTEFCTSIKPACFKFLFSKFNIENCIYFDPDILVFNSLDYIHDKLATHSVVITPHIAIMEEVYSGELNEQSLLYSGIYNLGFIALKNDSVAKRILDWWDVRLKDRCYQNKMENLFTDQKWIDFLPGFFSKETYVSSNLGMNFAPWNFHERRIEQKDNSFWVTNKVEASIEIEPTPLLFVHFSGFNYLSLIKEGGIVQNNIRSLQVSKDIEPLFQVYKNDLQGNDFSQYIHLKYTYNFFSNNVPVSVTYRKLYRRLFEDKRIEGNPFQCKGKFYLALTKSGIIKKNIIKSDKTNLETVENAERKFQLINRIMFVLYKMVGAQRFFLLTRLMRLYSKTENHIYLIDKSYFKDFKIRS